MSETSTVKHSSHNINGTFCLMLDSRDLCLVVRGLSLEKVSAIFAVSLSSVRTRPTVKLINADMEIARFSSAINVSLSGFFSVLGSKSFMRLYCIKITSIKEYIGKGKEQYLISESWLWSKSWNVRHSLLKNEKITLIDAPVYFHVG